jgi:hypothetical protein
MIVCLNVKSLRTQFSGHETVIRHKHSTSKASTRWQLPQRGSFVRKRVVCLAVGAAPGWRDAAGTCTPRTPRTAHHTHPAAGAQDPDPPGEQPACRREDRAPCGHEKTRAQAARWHGWRITQRILSRNDSCAAATDADGAAASGRAARSVPRRQARARRPRQRILRPPYHHPLALIGCGLAASLTMAAAGEKKKRGVRDSKKMVTATACGVRAAPSKPRQKYRVGPTTTGPVSRRTERACVPARRPPSAAGDGR